MKDIEKQKQNSKPFDVKEEFIQILVKCGIKDE